MEILQILKAHHVGLGSMVDPRSNPSARQQVQAVIRRAAAPQARAAPAATAAAAPTAAASPQIAPPAPSTAQRLQELETLRATAAISEDEYASKRRQISADL